MLFLSKLKGAVKPFNAKARIFLIALVLPAMVYAQDAEMLSSDSEVLSNDGEVLSGDSEELAKPIVDEVEDLKQEVINLNRDLFILEEDLLFPATTQFVVFLSVDVGEFLDLDSVELKVDGKTVTTYLYTEKQIKALHKGGIQRLYTGNIRSGEHELTAFLTGTGPNERNYKLGTTKKFTKGSDITSLELRVMDSTKNYQPEFTVVEWE